MLPRKVIGVEQVNDTIINHHAIDFRPIFSIGVWVVFTVAAMVTTILGGN